MRKTALSIVVLASSLAVADKAAPKQAAGTHIAKVTNVTTVRCDTDGGRVPCPTGVRYMGELVQSHFNTELESAPIDCAGDLKPQSLTFQFGYDYNAGATVLQDTDKVQAKWPACVKTFAKQAGDTLLTWFKLLQPIDGSIDVSSNYKVTIAIKK